jgi:hypothetical protein
VSQARNGRRIHPTKFRAIARALAEIADLDPIPGLESLIDHDEPAGGIATGDTSRG